MITLHEPVTTTIIESKGYRVDMQTVKTEGKDEYSVKFLSYMSNSRKPDESRVMLHLVLDKNGINKMKDSFLQLEFLD